MALSLSRFVGESIAIGDDIVFTIVRTSSSKVQIRFHAPHDVKIVRTELLDLDATENHKIKQILADIKRINATTNGGKIR